MSSIKRPSCARGDGSALANTRPSRVACAGSREPHGRDTAQWPHAPAFALVSVDLPGAAARAGTIVFCAAGECFERNGETRIAYVYNGLLKERESERSAGEEPA